MSTKTTLVLALAAGFLGGIASQHVLPASVWAQDQIVPLEIRAHKFVLVDDDGVSRGVLGFGVKKGKMDPTIEMMDAKGNRWSFTRNPFWLSGLLPDTTCQTCASTPSKTGP
jgi:hypothetical protein